MDTEPGLISTRRMRRSRRAAEALSLITSGTQPVLCQNSDSHDIPKRRPTALGPVANTDTKLLIYGLFQKGRVLAQDGDTSHSRFCSRAFFLPPCVPHSAFSHGEPGSMNSVVTPNQDNHSRTATPAYAATVHKSQSLSRS